jgi:hypothetical protein
VEGSCERGNGPSGFINKARNILLNLVNITFRRRAVLYDIDKFLL